MFSQGKGRGGEERPQTFSPSHGNPTHLHPPLIALHLIPSTPYLFPNVRHFYSLISSPSLPLPPLLSPPLPSHPDPCYSKHRAKFPGALASRMVIGVLIRWGQQGGGGTYHQIPRRQRTALTPETAEHQRRFLCFCVSVCLYPSVVIRSMYCMFACNLSVCLSVCLSVSISCHSMYSVKLPVISSASMIVCLPVIYLSVCMSVCLSVCIHQL